VTVYAPSGCTGYDTISVWFLPLTEVIEYKTDNTFEIYPNPAKDYISISLHHFTENINLHILSMDGVEVHRSNLKPVDHFYSEGIDISFLDTGVYLIKLQHVDGTVVDIRKLVKQ